VELRDRNSSFYIGNIAIVLAAIATPVLTIWKLILSHKATEIKQKKAEIEESTRQDGVLEKAVSFLNERNDLTTRKAGVHLLKDLAMTSPRHAQKCIDMLCSLNESWMPKFLNDYPDFFVINEDFPNIKNIEELTLYRDKYVFNMPETKIYIDRIALSQLVLLSMAEIIRYINENNEHQGPFDLQYKYLCSINLSRIVFKKDKFNFNHIYLQSADVWDTNLQDAKFQEASLQNTCFLNADLRSTDLLGAYLQNASLPEANLQNAILYQAFLQEVDLSNSNLQNADIQRANLRNANLQDSDLQNANLCQAFMQRVNLSNSNLRNADLSSTNLQNAYLDSADFTGARLYLTDFRNAKNVDAAFFDNNAKDAIFTDEDYKRHYPL
jgi:uncharacterized protein YjbI with pentapeptide repeats